MSTLPPEFKGKKHWTSAFFGLIFLLGGVAVFWFTAGTMMTSYVTTHDWIEVPANIHSLDLKASNTSDGTTYRVVGNYSYQLDGRTHQNDRISLSTGSDSIGDYWHDLHDELLKAKYSNEAVAIVNPDNPSQSFLDRTFRLSELLFGSVFLLMFGGVGSFFLWVGFSSANRPTRHANYDATMGIKSQQRLNRWFLTGFGGMFFFLGLIFSIIAIPEAIEDGEYHVLLTLVFVVIGGIILRLAWREWRAYRRFGATALYLDPVNPGLGGQLGARFNINLVELTRANNTLTATLSSTRVSKSGKSTNRDIKWRKDTPVCIKQTATGLEGSTLFDIPKDCRATKTWKKRSAIEWTLHVSGDFHEQGLGEFKRTWEVHVSKEPPTQESSVHLPESFVDDFEERAEENARTEAISQIEVTEQSGSIGIKSKAGRYKGQHFFAMTIGAVFAGAGAFSLGEWFGAYIFLAIGLLVVTFSIHALGSAVNTTIEKATKAIRMQYSWFGLTYKTFEAEIEEPSQVDIKMTSNMQSGDEVTEYYAVHAIIEGKKRTIAKGIEGEDVAQALQDIIIEKCFDKSDYRAAA